MNILVTGSNGQLGREMQDVTKDSNNNYIFTDIAELDITDLEAVRIFVSVNKADVIVNCAAYTNVEKAEDDIDTADLINHKAAANLSMVAKETGAVLIHISTDYVFNGEHNTPCTEELKTNPLGVYGRTKLNGEKAIEKSDCKYLIFRTSWLYSPYGNNFVKTMQKLTAERDTLKVVFDQVGTPTYAHDLANSIVTVISDRRYVDNYGIYHYSNEGVCSWYDFAVEIASQFGNQCDIQPCRSNEFPSKVQRPHFSVLDKSRIKTILGIKIPHWRDSLIECVKRLK